METAYTEGKTFDKVHFKEKPVAKGEYENCSFVNCDLSNADLGEVKFIDCEFVNSNLSLSKLSNTSFREVTFKECKMLGLHFEHCNEFGLTVGFDNCNLSHCSFYQVKLKKTGFKNSLLSEADFTESDLTSSVFDNCDFTNATFENTIIEKADFRTSRNYSIDPTINRVKKAKFSLLGAVGLLDKFDIEIEIHNS